MDVTIIIPTYNRSEALIETLEALARVDYPANAWEAIVVDDGSTDDTATAVVKWIRQSGVSVRFLQQKNAGPAAARNRGAAEARGAALIFIDNDIVVPPSFIQAHLRALKSHPGCWILGRVLQPQELSQTPFGRYRDTFHESFHRTYASNVPSETNGMTGQNVSMPTDDFHRLGGFDEGFTIASSEDWELGLRARQTGIRVLYHPDIVVLHNDWAVSLDQFCKRQMMYSISDVLLWQKYGKSSPRERLVRESAPINWSVDQPSVIVKKVLKRFLATSVGEWMVVTICKLAERWVPDSTWNHRAYNLAVAIAIFRGVREGWQRYGLSSLTNQRNAQFKQA